MRSADELAARPLVSQRPLLTHRCLNNLGGALAGLDGLDRPTPLRRDEGGDARPDGRGRDQRPAQPRVHGHATPASGSTTRHVALGRHANLPTETASAIAFAPVSALAGASSGEGACRQLARRSAGGQSAEEAIWVGLAGTRPSRDAQCGAYSGSKSNARSRGRRRIGSVRWVLRRCRYSMLRV